MRNRYGCTTVEKYDSFASIHKSGCTDETQNENGVSQSIRWGDPNLEKGSERGTQGLRNTTG